LILPLVEKGETLKLNSITPTAFHFTEPPRYTEATLAKALEEKGIGRPSTYAAIASTIQERVRREAPGTFSSNGIGNDRQRSTDQGRLRRSL
jgi:DNA topoisomerase-1